MTAMTQRGMICLACEDDGPCLVVGWPEEIPVGRGRAFLEFTCGGCGRHWSWSYDGITYRFEREITEEDDEDA